MILFDISVGNRKWPFSPNWFLIYFQTFPFNCKLSITLRVMQKILYCSCVIREQNCPPEFEISKYFWYSNPLTGSTQIVFVCLFLNISSLMKTQLIKNLRDSFEDHNPYSRHMVIVYKNIVCFWSKWRFNYFLKSSDQLYIFVNIIKTIQ